MSVLRPSSASRIGVLLLVCLGPCSAQDTPTDAPATNVPVASMADPVKSLLTESSKDLAEGDYESAIRDASTAIQLDPKNPSAFELRGTVYIEEKLWDRAERDYLSASKISPDPVYKYKLAEIKFLQKSYEDARSRFAALEGDEHLGDLATYKVFLCDLLGFHDATAMQDLAEMDQRSHTSAYYYSHAAWDLFHGNRAEAGKYFTAADQLYGTSNGALYLASLVESRRFTLASASFATKDGTPYQNASVFLESDGLRISTPKGWITVPLDQLPDDLSGFPEELREKIDRMRAIAPDGPVPASLVTFTTRSGKVYHDVRWAMQLDGLSVLTTAGWIVVPFAELPADQSSFPGELKHALAQKQGVPEAGAPLTEVVSFTTTGGKVYHQAKVFLADDGLSVLTPQGWITVPFGELPKDLSVFPVGWRSQIQAGRGGTAIDPSGMESVSFTTIHDKVYTDAKTILTHDGLHVLTSGGWITVPFADLPKDTSVFPAGWRSQIQAGRAGAGTVMDSSGMEVVSFTTIHGTNYPETKAILVHDGLHVLTSGGWITIPFGDLPKDVSVFPAGWRSQIQAGRTAPAPDSSDTEVVTFTTNLGKHFDQVRASLGRTGLHLVTPQGWIDVPFKDLPRDLTVFPNAWRETITEQQTTVAKDKPATP